MRCLGDVCVYVFTLYESVYMCYVCSFWGLREPVVIRNKSLDERRILKQIQAAHMTCCPSQDFKAYELEWILVNWNHYLFRDNTELRQKKKNTTTNSSSSSLYSMLALIIKSKLKIDDGYKKILFILFYNYLIIK